MKKRDLLNEVAGVPRDIEPWVELYTDVMVDMIQELLKHGPEQSDEAIITIDGKNKQITVQGSEEDVEGTVVMYKLMTKAGYSELDDFLKSDLFGKLPLWRTPVIIDIQTIPNDMYLDLLRTKALINGAMITDPRNVKVKQLGKTPILTGISIKLNPILSNDFWTSMIPSDSLVNIKKLIKTTVAHELIHVYQVYSQVKVGKPAHFGKEIVLNAITPPLKNETLVGWDHFLKLIYLHLSFEINARVTELYYEMKEHGIKTKEDFVSYLKSSNTWSEMRELETFDADKFMENFKIPQLDVFDIDKMFRQMGELAKHGIGFKDSKQQALQKLIHVWDTVLQGGVNFIEREFDTKLPMDRVPEKVKKNPVLFFKFFEQRFHKKAEKFKRKLHKLYSIVVE